MGTSSLLAGFPRKGSRPLLLLVLLLQLGGGAGAWAQPAVGSEAPAAVTDSTTVTAQKVATEPASTWTTVLAVLGGVGIGALGAWLWARRTQQPTATGIIAPDTPEIKTAPIQKRPAENVRKAPAQLAAPAAPLPAPPEAPSAENTGKGVSFKSLREVQGTVPKPAGKSAGAGKKNKPNFNSRSSASANSSGGWPAVPPRPAIMNPNSPSVTPVGGDQPLETGQTVEWAAPTSTPPAIQEMIDASAAEAPIDRDARVESLMALEAAAGTAPAPSNGSLHFYAPAPDVPSIEHRKLSPNPLPQMPLLITLAHAEASTAQYSFSPQADQSRIIGNGIQELREFFVFEVPLSEQFTTITNLVAGKLEKREGTWHVVQKAEIALR
ncbi:hypothetical protein [Hymenobacter glacialis]|uniref:Uncharacterized protein n=1 Tax=Hymenobacter glacialis TaxID=1908236 RepID=A0A1G1TCS5_9BACT|nr:hypothetical protein [Hymenobacter glacialis]OGX88658.1 hypothetical protein BEN48_08515 [Hymenobacter glacialis]